MKNQFISFYCILGVKSFYNKELQHGFNDKIDDVVKLIKSYESLISKRYKDTGGTSIMEEYYKLEVYSRGSNVFIDAIPKSRIKNSEKHLLVSHNASAMYHMMIKVSFVIQTTLHMHKILLSGYLSDKKQNDIDITRLGIFGESTGMRVYIDKSLSINNELMTAFYKLRDHMYNRCIAISTDFKLCLKSISYLGITLALMKKLQYLDYQEAKKMFLLNKIFIDSASLYINPNAINQDDMLILGNNHNNIIDISNGLLDESYKVNVTVSAYNFTPEIGDILLVSGSKFFSLQIIKNQKKNIV